MISKAKVNTWFFIIGLLCLLVCPSCTIDRDKNFDSIALYQLDEKRTSLSQIGISHVSEIALACPDSIKFYQGGGSCITNNHLIVQDKITRSVLIFDRKGDFKKILHSTQNARELRLTKVRRDNIQISIIDVTNQEINFFDENLNYKYSKKHSPHSIESIILPNMKYYFYFPNKTCQNNTNNSFAYISENNEVFSFLKSVDQNSVVIPFFSIEFLLDDIVFWEYNRNSIYHIDSLNNVTQCYKLDLGKDRLDFRKVFNNTDLYNQSKETLSITRLLESSKHIFFESVNHGTVEFLLYDKLSQQIWIIEFPPQSQKLGIIDDINGQEPLLPQGVDNHGNYYTYTDKVHSQSTQRPGSEITVIGHVKIYNYEEK